MPSPCNPAPQDNPQQPSLPWVHVHLHGTDDTYGGELVARLQDGLVVRVVTGEHAPGGTHPFPSHAIASELQVPRPRPLQTPLSEHEPPWPREIPGDHVAALLRAFPLDRLLLVEELGDDEVCWIGFPTLDGDAIVLREVDTSGDPSTTQRFAITGLSHIAWGGTYLTSLEEVIHPGITAVHAFAAAACRLLNIQHHDPDDPVLHRALSALHLQALELPDGNHGQDRVSGPSRAALQNANPTRPPPRTPQPRRPSGTTSRSSAAT